MKRLSCLCRGTKRWNPVLLLRVQVQSSPVCATDRTARTLGKPLRTMGARLQVDQAFSIHPGDAPLTVLLPADWPAQQRSRVSRVFGTARWCVCYLMTVAVPGIGPKYHARDLLHSRPSAIHPSLFDLRCTLGRDGQRRAETRVFDSRSLQLLEAVFSRSITVRALPRNVLNG